MRLSPLNFRGLLDTLRVVGEPAQDTSAKPRRPRPIECWRCPDCQEVYEWESDAEDCCAEAEVADAQNGTSCPVCAQAYDYHRDAADCCLWKDLDVLQRWRIADAVERGSTWLEQLGLNAQAGQAAKAGGPR